MNRLTINALLVLLAAAALVLGAWQIKHRIASAEARAAAAETRANRLQAELQQAQMSERVVTVYVDRVRTVRERGATITREIPIHVTAKADAACPVPAGFVRVHDAAAQGVPLDPAAGDPDAPVPGLALSGVADAVAGNYTTCHETAAQLSALQAWVRGLQGIETP
ncbi:hypothetical protein [Thermomonas fusca]